MRKLFLIAFLVTGIITEAFTQSDHKKIDVGGYISNMFSYTRLPEGYGLLLGLQEQETQWLSNHYLQNRLNFYVYPVKNLKGSIQLRNRFFYGDYIGQIPAYTNMLSQDGGYTDLSYNVIDGNGYALNMNIDRLWLQYTLEDFEIKAGRQRINWSQTFAFNPNDIFNTYSFFEVDYPERPGADAVRLSWYPSFSSTVEAAAAVDSAGQVTAAGFYRFNKWNYDFQVLAGVMAETDFVFGLGWSGSIKGVGFRGEASWFEPMEEEKNSESILVASVAFDYMFRNSLYMQLEALYNELPAGGGAGFYQLFSRPLSPKMLSFTEYTLLLNGNYPINPLWNAGMSLIYYPEMDAVFAGPSVEYSIAQNLSASLFWQTFSGKFDHPFMNTGTSAFHFGYFRVKYNF